MHRGTWVEGAVLGGKYRMLRRIAEGGMGTIWEVEHVEIGRRLAVKVLHAEYSRNVEVVARFRREAQIAGTLGHDHICPVLDVGQDDQGQPYLVMELLRGRCLADALAEDRALAIERALDITAQILEALIAAHAAGVVHRDLKPENVFLSRVGGRDDFVRVLDFGISKVAEQDGKPTTALTRTGFVMGTPHYMAPEQARGQKDLDARVDVYAVGAILYEMLTGSRAYDGNSVNEIIIKLATEPFTLPSALRPDLPRQVEAIVLRAMARSRDERFATASEMSEAVSHARGVGAAIAPEASRVSAAPTLPRTSTPLAVTRSQVAATPALPPRRVPIVIAAAGVLLAVGLGVIAWVAVDGLHTPQTVQGPAAGPPLTAPNPLGRGSGTPPASLAAQPAPPPRVIPDPAAPVAPVPSLPSSAGPTKVTKALATKMRAARRPPADGPNGLPAQSPGPSSQAGEPDFARPDRPIDEPNFAR